MNFVDGWKEIMGDDFTLSIEEKLPQENPWNENELRKHCEEDYLQKIRASCVHS